MGKNIKDYMNLFIGGEILIDGRIRRKLHERNFADWHRRAEWRKVQIILRPLPDITEVEFIELAKLQKRGLLNGIDIDALEAEQFRFLLLKQFDLFGLIKSDLGVDKTTLK